MHIHLFNYREKLKLPYCALLVMNQQNYWLKGMEIQEINRKHIPKHLTFVNYLKVLNFVKTKRTKIYKVF